MGGLETLPKAKQIHIERKIKHNKYSLIKEYNHRDGWNIEWMCKKLNISRAAYYKWTKRSETKLDIENKEVSRCIKEIASINNRLYGTLKMTFTVNKKLGKNYNHKRIYRIMCVNNQQSVFRKSNRYRWKRSSPQITAENTLNRVFEVSKPNKVWCTDVTEIAYPGIKDKAYISSYLDLYDRSVPGISVSKRNDVELTNKSIERAIKANPNAKPLHHSDRGFQYTRMSYKRYLENYGIKQSMSRVGRCIDNGPMESFQGIFKELLIILHPNLKIYEELEEAIYQTLDYYHNEYPQVRFKGLTALQVRENALATDFPEQYPITPNPKVVKFWDKINQLKTKNQAEINQLGLV